MASATRSDDRCAIFVHAGAGFHSRENEPKHLAVCAAAAEAAMTFMRHGGSAVEAVEVAIMVLEDHPITNSGYGSNLNQEGVVECDASIMDHFGRSGAVGAVATVKNPIQLARKIYEKAYRMPGMQRVPPNFLCGQGAANFAWENNVVVIPNDMMVAPHSRLRWRNWKAEIAEYERKHHKKGKESLLAQGLRVPNRDWVRYTQGYTATRLQDLQQGLVAPPVADGEQTGYQVKETGDSDSVLDGIAWSADERPMEIPTSSAQRNHYEPDGEDMITDTVGAIAVDIHGNIAAGASSGGIGMKHEGRIGPAALIGIGTHVIPVDPTDEDQVSVAVVTSGTGEHIATTFAASVCARRIYSAQKVNPGGTFEDVTEDEAIHAMIQNEFCHHPGVVNSEIPSSIGIMAVKQDKDGISLYFAHNTESMALCSLGSEDEFPNCVMSRIPSPGLVAQGGLRIRKNVTEKKASAATSRGQRSA